MTIAVLAPVAASAAPEGAAHQATWLPDLTAQQPKPTTAAQARTQIAELQTNLEIVTESWNAANVRLGRRKTEQRQATVKLTTARAKITALKGQVRQIAVANYTGGDIASFSSLVSTGSPGEFVDRLSTLGVIATQEKAVLANYQGAEQAAQSAATAARQALAGQKTITAGLASKKSWIISHIGVLKQERATLAVKERAERIARARAARERAARIARERAARIAAEAARIAAEQRARQAAASATPTPSTQSTQTTQTTDPTPSTSPAQTTDPTPATSPTQTTDPTPSTSPAQTTDPTPSTTPAQATESTPPTQAAQTTESTPPTQPTQTTESTPPTQTTETTESTAPSKSDTTSNDNSGSGSGSSGGESSKAAIALETAKAQLGKPYAWGADGPDAFDCSGLTMYAWAAAGVSLPHSSADQINYGTQVSVNDVQPGDLVFYYSPIHHVAIYAGNGEIIHASTEGEPVKYGALDHAPITGVTRPG
ncbi:MAG: NlpC/P60 family protein [Mycobacteriales bacterium]